MWWLQRQVQLADIAGVIDSPDLEPEDKVIIAFFVLVVVTIIAAVMVVLTTA